MSKHNLDRQNSNCPVIHRIRNELASTESCNVNYKSDQNSSKRYFFSYIWKNYIVCLSLDMAQFYIPYLLKYSYSLSFRGTLVHFRFLVVLCVVDRCLFFCNFSFGHCVVCSSSIYGLWLPLWYLQNFCLSITI